MLSALRRTQLAGRSPLGLGHWLDATWGTLSGRNAEGLLAQALTDRFDCEGVALLGSGTQSLQSALEAAREARPAPVLLPAYSCYDIASAAVGARAPVIFYDLDPSTLAPDLDTVRAGLMAGAGTVVAGPLYGIPFPWAPLRSLAGEFDALLVEDAAQGQGARTPEGRCGALGDLSVLSFGRGKGWTGGGGGALLYHRGEAELPGPALEGAGAVPIAAKSLVQWGLGRPSLYGVPSALPFLGLGETRYKPPRPPERIAPWSAALALSTMAAADDEARVRAEHARHIDDLLDARGLGQVRRIRVDQGVDASYLRYPVRIPEANRVLTARARRLGLAPGYPRSLTDLSELADQLVSPPGACAGAREIAATLLTLPTHALVRRGEYEAMVDLLSGS